MRFRGDEAVAETFRIEPGRRCVPTLLRPPLGRDGGRRLVSFSIPFDTHVCGAGRSRDTDQQANATPASLPAADWLIGARRQDQGGRGSILDEARAETTGVTEHTDDESVLRDWLSVLARQKWIVLLAVTVVPLFAFAASRGQERRYQASSTVLVDSQNPSAQALESRRTAAASPPDRYVATQAKLARWEVSQRWRLRRPTSPDHTGSRAVCELDRERGPHRPIS